MSDDFENTVQRRMSPEQARHERGKEVRRSWHRRKEDVIEYERRLAEERRRERRRDIKDWLLIIAVIVSLTMGQWERALVLLGG